MDSFLVKASLFVPTVLLSIVSEVEGKYCFVVDNGQTKYFPCGPFQHCCGTSCCENFGPFYRLWYFWLCVMLALMFCSFGGYWYRRHYFQHRLIGSSQSSVGRNTVMMLMMNNIQTNNHYDVASSRTNDFYYPARSQRLSSQNFVRSHRKAPFISSAASVQWTAEGVRYHAPAQAMSTPPPSYYETVHMPPPPDYSYFNSQVGQCDPPPPHFDDPTPRHAGHSGAS